jgi:hypothetical protein
MRHPSASRRPMRSVKASGEESTRSTARAAAARTGAALRGARRPPGARRAPRLPAFRRVAIDAPIAEGHRSWPA